MLSSGMPIVLQQREKLTVSIGASWKSVVTS